MVLGQWVWTWIIENSDNRGSDNRGSTVLSNIFHTFVVFDLCTIGSVKQDHHSKLLQLLVKYMS